MSYRVLALDPYSTHMSLPVLRALHKLVESGAVVAGAKPSDDPSLADDAAEFTRLNDELFGDGTGVHSVGKGKVYAGQNAEAVLKTLTVAPDFAFSKSAGDSQIPFVHRKTAGADIYFLDNRSDQPASVDASFRIAGKEPGLWYSESGKIKPASYTIADGRTTVPLQFEPWGTVFVVFRGPAKASSRTVPKEVETPLATVDGSWNVAFQEGRGAPASITLDKLISWNDSSDMGVKYFSGSGTYTKTIQASADWFKPGAQLWIDLGDVKNLAEVTLNGKSLGVVWHAPYRLDVTGALKSGANELKIVVINPWVNRLIGDQQPDATTKYTFAPSKPYKANSPLVASGLLGPVQLISTSTEK